MQSAMTAAAEDCDGDGHSGECAQVHTDLQPTCRLFQARLRTRFRPEQASMTIEDGISNWVLSGVSQLILKVRCVSNVEASDELVVRSKRKNRVASLTHAPRFAPAVGVVPFLLLGVE
eukprot:3243563-Pleurochrysis_carterae.AAC.1